MEIKFISLFDRCVGGPAVKCFAFCCSCFQRKKATLPESPQEIVVLKMFGGGALILAASVFLALKQHYPKARLTLLSTASVSGHGALLGIFDEILVINEKRLSLLLFSAIRQLFKIRHLKPDLIINLEVYSNLSALYTTLLNSKYVIGFRLPGNRHIQKLQDCSLSFSVHGRVFEYYDAIADFLGIKAVKDMEWREYFLNNLTPIKNGKDDSPLLVIAPFCSALSFYRQWGLDKWTELLNDFFHSYPSWRLIILGGAKDKSHANDIFNRLSSDFLHKVRVECGSLPLKEAAAVIRDSDIFVGIDSAPVHMARLAAQRTISLWGATDPDTLLRPVTWLRETIIQAKAVCSPCVHTQKGAICGKKPLCMNEITPTLVFSEIKNMMQEFTPGTRKVSIKVVCSKNRG